MLECIVHIELNRLYKPLEYDICDLNESSYECVFAIVKGNATRQLIQACNDLSNEKTSCDNLLIIADAGNRDIEVDEGNQDKTCLSELREYAAKRIVDLFAGTLRKILRESLH